MGIKKIGLLNEIPIQMEIPIPFNNITRYNIIKQEDNDKLNNHIT